VVRVSVHLCSALFFRDTSTRPQMIRFRDRPPGMTDNRIVPDFLEDWESLLASDKEIDFAVIKELARHHCVTRGSWLFCTDTTVEADHCWNKVVTAIAEKRLPSYAATVVPGKKRGSHRFSIYNKDFTDEDAVYQVERTLRSLGIHTDSMFYKPNIYSHLNISLTNAWPGIRMRPFIYFSDYQSNISVYVNLLKLHSRLYKYLFV